MDPEVPLKRSTTSSDVFPNLPNDQASNLMLFDDPVVSQTVFTDRVEGGSGFMVHGGGPVGGHVVPGETDTRSRERKPTDKGLQFALDLKHKELRANITKYKRLVSAVEKEIADSENSQSLRNLRDELENVQSDIACVLDDESLVQMFDQSLLQRTEFIEPCHIDLLRRITEKLRELESDVKTTLSSSSSRSKRSRRSNISSVLSKSSVEMIAEAAAEVAKTKSDLAHLDEEGKLKTEMERLRLVKQLETSSAKFSVLEKIVAPLSPIKSPSQDSTMKRTSGDEHFYETASSKVSPVVTHVAESLKNDKPTDAFTEQSLLSEGSGLRVVSGQRAGMQSASLDPLAEVFRSTSAQCTNTLDADHGNLKASSSIPHFVETPVGNDPLSDALVEPLTSLENTSPGITPKQQTVAVSDPLGKASDSVLGSSSYADHHMHDFMKRMSDQMHMSRVQILEPGVFSGDFLQYPSWKSAFDILIDRRDIPQNEKIYYLKRYLAGEAKETIEGFLLVPTADSYQAARDLLDQRYGNPFSVANAFRARLDAWPNIQPRDGLGLRKFSDFLQQCAFAMDTVPSLTILNDEHENKKIIKRLPEWLIVRWARFVTEWRDRHHMFPPFVQLANLVAKEARVACDPTVSLQALSREKRPAQQQLGAQKPKVSGTFATNSAPEAAPERKKKQVCFLCSRVDHSLNECQAFLKKSYDDRREYVLKNGLCFGCLRRGHVATRCRIRQTCKRCAKRHPTSLHDDNFKREDAVPEENPSEEEITSASSARGSARDVHGERWSKSSAVVLVMVSHSSQPNLEVPVYAMLDTQSDATFILDSTLASLGAPSTKTHIHLDTMSSSVERLPTNKVSGLIVRGIDSDIKIELPQTYSRPRMPINKQHIPAPEMAEHWPHLRRLSSQLHPLHDCDVGLLIGYNCTKALIPREVIPDPDNVGPYGLRTDLGWSIVGVVSFCPDDDDQIGVSHRILTRTAGASEIVIRNSVRESFSGTTGPDVAKILQQDFIEHPGPFNGEPYSQEDVKFLRLVGDGIRVCPDGHYEIPLPLRKEMLPLGSNRVMAESRLQSLAKKFKRDPAYRKAYTEVVEALLEKGYAEEAKRKPDAWFLPHHGVKHPRKPDKVRVVFDAAANYRGQALNDVLMSGPDLTNKLVGVLCRFRLEDVALSCDIEAMFHQFRVPTSDRDYLRFLWWQGGDLALEPKEFRMCVHVFGATSSPACTNYGLKQVAKDYGHNFSEAASEFISRDFYVDDGLVSKSSEAEILNLVDETSKMCKQAGLTLHKFLSNSETVTKAVQPDGTIPQKGIESGIERVLGVCWCIENDTFGFRIEIKATQATRRSMLSTIASIYDPLGLVAPVLLIGKQILQETCRDNLDWDESLPEELETRWFMWVDGLIQLNDLSIERCYKPKKFGPITNLEFHHFADASTLGYGTCSYLRQVNELGQTTCALVLAKSRVAPLKSITVPRLELTAALTAARIGTFLRKELNGEIPHFYWSDSKVVLGYLKNNCSKYEVFVANRVQEIRDSTASEQWHHVGTKENPADLASRGCSTLQLQQQDAWFKGPSFLRLRDWKSMISDVDSTQAKADEVTRECLATSSVQIPECDILSRMANISSWEKMKRVIAICINFPQIAKRAVHPSLFTSVHLRQAETVLVSLIQQRAFCEEIRCLKGGRPVRSNSPLVKLDPFLDEKGLVRVGGRIGSCDLEFHTRHPVVLPKDSPVSLAILRFFHARIAHQGRAMTVNESRSNGFWVLHAGRLASSIIANCVTCKRLRASPCDQKMGNLPEDRLEVGPPFTNVGVDFFGPFIIKEGRKELKRWGCIFTCLSSRAVHLEVAANMSADGFINALRRFIGIRGPIARLRCDRGTNFVGANSELKQALSEMDDSKLREYLRNNSCEFVFNAPHASRTGGVWERCIRTVRSVLNSTLKEHATLLDDDSLRTLMVEAAAIVNSRPLSVDNLYDPTAPMPITPNHLLTMKTSAVLPPPGKFLRADLYSRKRWRRVQHLMNVFWCRWKSEYVQHLQSRQKLTRTRKNLKIGDVVLIVDETTSRGQWHLGRISETIVSSDGLVRKVKLAVGDSLLNAKGKRTRPISYLERPVHKLVLLVDDAK